MPKKDWTRRDGESTQPTQQKQRRGRNVDPLAREPQPKEPAPENGSLEEREARRPANPRSSKDEPRKR